MECSFPSAKNIVYDDVERWEKSGLFTFAILYGPVGWGIRIFGFAQLMDKMVICHEEINELTQLVEKVNLILIERLVSRGINGVIIADDIAFNQGLFFRPAILRQMAFTSLARQV